MLSFLRRAKNPSCTPPIFNIPEELIAEIAYHTRDWSSIANGVDASLVNLPGDLSSLSTTCSVLHEAVTPLLYRDVQITSAMRLRSLGAASPKKLDHIRVLSLHLDSDFFAEFAHSIDHRFRSLGFANHPSASQQNPPGSPPPLIQVLCSILVRTPHIQSLVIRLAKASSRSSAWKHFSFRSRGIELGQSFRNCLSSAQREKQSGSTFEKFILPDLTHIHLDALEDLGPLLGIAPNLTHLSVRMLEGFDAVTCQQLVSDLRWTKLSKLTSLALSPRSLHLPETHDSPVAGVELLWALGKVCPILEELDLKVHAYGSSNLPFVSVYNQSSSLGLVSALGSFTHLRALRLPGNLLAEDEMDLFLLPEESDGQFSPERRTMLKEVTKRELAAVVAMSNTCTTLSKVSWVRRKVSDINGMEYSVEYDIEQDYRYSPDTSTIDRVTLHRFSPPPMVLEIPRTISSPARGPTILGYSRSSEGLREFRHDHPMVWLFSMIILWISFCATFFFRFDLVMHAIVILGIAHMVYTRSFSFHVTLLVVANSLLFPRQLSKKVANYSRVVGLV